jgi:ribosomal protein L37AE/L43A
VWKPQCKSNNAHIRSRECSGVWFCNDAVAAAGSALPQLSAAADVQLLVEHLVQFVLVGIEC